MKAKDKRRLKRRARKLARASDPENYEHQEPASSRWERLQRVPQFDRDVRPDFAVFLGEWIAAEWYQNDRYYVMADWFRGGFAIGEAESDYCVIGISSMDETARHDWRDFQEIKNDICGEEWEAIELYPSESRKVDPSNRFYLFAVPPGVLQFGMRHRRVADYQGRGHAPQRPFPK